MKLTLRVLFILSIAFMLIPPAPSLAHQNPESQTRESQTHDCRHDGHSIDFWSNVRLMPVKILGLDGNKVQWKFEDKYEVRIGNLEFIPATVFSIGKNNKRVDREYFVSHQKGVWGFVYCDKCKKVLEAYEL